ETELYFSLSVFNYLDNKHSFNSDKDDVQISVMQILNINYISQHISALLCFRILLVSIAILSAYSIHLLLRSAGVVGIRAYEQLGNRAFGPPGKILAACIITIHNIGAMSSYLFIVKSELPLVIQAFLSKHENTGEWFLNGNYLIIIVSAVIILPLALMKQLGMFFILSSRFIDSPYSPMYTSCLHYPFLLRLLPCPVIYKKFNIPCPLGDEHHNVTPIADHHTVINGTINDDFCKAKLFTTNSQTAYTIPILAFAFVCHPEVLPIYTELRDATKKRMQTVANISIMAMFVMYLLTALFGYLTFFGAVESELLHTYSRVDPLDVLVLCVRLAVLVAVTLTVPVVLFPIRRALLQILFPDKPFRWSVHITIAFCLLFLVNLLVIFVPSIRDIFGLIGATSAPSLIFILPGIFYVRIVPEEQEPFLSRPKIQAACFAALGFIFMIMSLSFIIIDWVTGESRSGGGH
uniref:Solute carrier family 38 member 5a n=1 Tax=Dicentrarchus labrax TaxID=13489 RepID=A0A8C4GLA4_DICLA